VRALRAPSGLPSLFLDRDGVINRRRPDHVKSWSEFEFLPGVLEALVEVRRAGITVIVVTNQSVVGRGLIREQDLLDIHGHMLDAVADAGGHIDGIYACPHRPEDQCRCRKPATDLFVRASLDLGVALHESVMVGDSQGDVEAAWNAGCQPILVAGQRPPALPHVVPVVPDLLNALPIIWRLCGREARCS
jgi:histidinol-phosphate phosphatase family protein